VQQINNAVTKKVGKLLDVLRGCIWLGLPWLWFEDCEPSREYMTHPLEGIRISDPLTVD